MATYLEEKSKRDILLFGTQYNKLVSGAAKALPSSVGDCVKHMGLADSYKLKEDAIVFTKNERYLPAKAKADIEISIEFSLVYDKSTGRVAIEFDPAKVTVPGKRGKTKTAYVGYSEAKAAEIAKAIETCLRDVPRSFARNVASLNVVSRGVKKPKESNNPATQAMMMPNVLNQLTEFLAPSKIRRNVTASRNRSKHITAVLRSLAEDHYNVNPNKKAERMGWTKGKPNNATRKNKPNKEPKGNQGPRGAGGNEA